MARRILNSSEYYTSYSVSTFLGQSQHMGATWTYITLPPFDISPDLKIALSSLQCTHWLKPSRLGWQRLKRRLQRRKRTVEKQQLRLQQLLLQQLKVDRHIYFFWRNLAWGRKKIAKMTVKSEVNELELKVRCPINLELSEWRSEDFITFKKTITNKRVFWLNHVAELCDTSGVFMGAGAAKFDKPTGKNAWHNKEKWRQ